jgi:hypothetical protein
MDMTFRQDRYRIKNRFCGGKLYPNQTRGNNLQKAPGKEIHANETFSGMGRRLQQGNNHA